MAPQPWYLWPEMDGNREVTQSGLVDEQICSNCRISCSQYMSHPKWKDLAAREAIVDLLDGRVHSNHRLYVVINLRVHPGEADAPDCPRKLVVRIFGTDYSETQSDLLVHPRTFYCIMSHILFQNGLGPEIYGCFEGGIVEAYINRTLTPASCPANVKIDLWDPAWLKDVIKKLVQVHCLKMPSVKEPFVLLNKAKDMYEKAKSFDNYRNMTPDFYPDEIRRWIYYLLEWDGLGDFNWIMDMIEYVKPSVCFCHNDMSTKSNVIVQDARLGQDTLVIRGFDNCGYGYRGYDIALMFFLRDFDHRDNSTWKTAYFCTPQQKHQILNTYLSRLRSMKEVPDSRNMTDKQLSLEVALGEVMVSFIVKCSYLMKINTSLSVPYADLLNRMEIYERTVVMSSREFCNAEKKKIIDIRIANESLRVAEEARALAQLEAQTRSRAQPSTSKKRRSEE